MIPLPPLATLRLAAAAGALAVAAAGGWTLEHWRMRGQIEAERAETARVRAEHAQAVANAASAALTQSEANRATEAIMRRRIQEVENARTKERTALAAARARADNDATGLRQQLAAFTCAAPASQATGNPGTASSVPAANLGELLGAVLSDYRSVVEAAESHAADVRALLAAWPKVTP